MKAYILLTIILIGTFLLITGIEKVPNNCNCEFIGINHCLGKINCNETNQHKCTPLTCETQQKLLELNNNTFEKKDRYTILIIDASKSMEGENIDATTKASKEFIQKIGEQEQIAIIEFNEKAQIITEFTNDKIDLFKGIDIINPRGKTRFYEPFKLSNELFSQIPDDANKYVIFLSDGTPEDDEKIFMEELNKLKETNVNIYTVAFIGKSNEKLITQIATTKENVFSVRNSKDINDKFTQIYNTITTKQNIYVETINFPKIARTEEKITATINSIYTNENLLEDKKYCELNIKTYMEAKHENKPTQRIVGKIINSKIEFPLNTLQTGEYDIIIHSKIKLNNCSLSVTKDLGTIQIIEESTCQTNCELIKQSMKGTKNYSYERENDESISWIILIDKSSSMEQNLQLEKAIEDTEKLISYLPSQDSVTLGSFDNKVDLIAIHQTAFSEKLNNFETIVPSSSTNLLTALQKAKKLEQTAPSKTHTIIISDGNYVETNLEEIQKIIKTINGCISTINYGTHLLTNKESAYELIVNNRKCGEDIITRPTAKELIYLTNSTKKYSPHLILKLRKNEQNNETIHIETTSSFTGKTPIINTEKCPIIPKTTINIIRINGTVETIQGNQFESKENESYTITSSYGNSDCKYTAKLEKTIPETTKQNNWIKIIIAVLIVGIIQFLTFIIVMNKKLKKAKKIIKQNKK